ncbi:MAG: hypothetical protein QXW70_01995 [Candidatus Anstonellales archaeon]
MGETRVVQDLQEISVIKPNKTAKERQRDEEWVRQQIGEVGIDIYKRIEGKRKFVDIEREVLLTQNELGSILASMQVGGVIRALDDMGKPIELNRIFLEYRRDREVDAGEKEEIRETKKRIKSIWGEKGIRIYDSVEGDSAFEDIVRKSGIPADETKKIIFEMEREGIIRLERNRETDTSAVSVKYIRNLGRNAIAYAKFLWNPLYFLVVFNAIMRFGLAALIVFKMIKKEATVPEIAAEAGISIKHALNIIEFFEKKKIVAILRFGREKIKEKYGAIGAEILKCFGSDGMLIYELYKRGKTPSEIIKQSGVSPSCVIEIIAFINKLCRIPIDAEKLLRYERYRIEMERS